MSINVGGNTMVFQAGKYLVSAASKVEAERQYRENLGINFLPVDLVERPDLVLVDVDGVIEVTAAKPTAAYEEAKK